jgi:putative ABC transport system permease protein
MSLSLFYRLFLRPLLRERLRTSLTLLAVALGVAVVLAIDLAGAAATGSFLSSVQTLAGEADFEITAIGGVPGEVVAKLVTLPYPLKIEPRIEDYAVVVNRHELVPLLGIDLVANAPQATESRANMQWIENQDCVWVTPGLAAKPEKRLKLQINDHLQSFTVCGILPPGFTTSERGDAIVMDISLAMTELNRNGHVDRVLITTPQHATMSATQWEEILRRALPPGLLLKTHGVEAQENRRMLEAFRWNLRVLGYIALLVGAFLIYNNLSVSVVRRRVEIGVLRALGATRPFIGMAFMGEALGYGMVGACLGIVLGRLLAQGMVGLIATTVESLYLTSRPAPITLTPGLVLLAFGVGIGVSLLSALLPAREASQVTPVEAMARAQREHRVRIHKGRLLLLAAACALGAAEASRLPAMGGKPLFGYLASLLLVAACVFALPALLAALASLASRPLLRIAGSEAFLALHGLAASLRRSSVLLAALTTAISMVVSVAIMVGSFRETVAIWLKNELQADFYIQPAEPNAVDRYPTLSPELASRIAALPQVAAVDALRAYSITYQGSPATLAGVTTRVEARYGHPSFLPGENASQIFKELEKDRAVVVSEPFSVKHKIHTGDMIRLQMPQGFVAFRVAGIYHDYSDPRGVIVMDRTALMKYLPDAAPSNLAVYLKPGVNLDVAREALEESCSPRKVVVLSNRALRDQALQVFDRTFKITYALEAIALCIAIIGMVGALVALVVDRKREIGLLRFLGSSTRQIRRMILCEAAILGVLSVFAGFVLGVWLSFILIFVINKQSFGWTIQFHWPIQTLVGAMLIVYVSTLAAGLYPARLGMNLNPIEVIHEE